MKRRLFLFLAIVVSAALPLSAWADVDLVTTADGTKFKIGMSTKFVPFTLDGLDLVADDRPDRFGLATGNYRSFISPDTTLGDTNWGIMNYNNLTFTLERGPLRIHANLEIESNIDAAAVDVNSVNMERFALYYKFEDFGTLAVGYDVHAFDPEGGLIYTDEHPGIWLVGGNENLSWDVAWHYVLNCDRGPSLFSNRGSFCPTTLTGLPGIDNLDAFLLGVTPNNRVAQPFAGDLDSGQNSQLFMGRVNINVTDGTTVSPMFGWYRRHVPQSGLLSEYSAPTGPIAAFPTSFVDNSKSDQFRPGVTVKSTAVSGMTFTFEGVGLLGDIRDVGAGFLGGTPAIINAAGFPTNTEDFDLASFALFFEVAVDGDTIGLPAGLTPYLSFEWHSGDSDPFDDTYGGYVPISNLSQALRKDGFKGQSISSFGPASLGANSEDGWGFDVTGRGIGPTLGAIVPDETLGVTCVFADPECFNNRGGKGGNPGFFKVAGGITGKINEKWDTHFGFNVYWWDEPEATVAEAAQNCTQFGGFGCTLGDPRIESTTRSNMGVMKGALADLENRYMGFEFNGNIGYNLKGGLRVQPYFSVFIPGSSVEAINTAFVGSSATPIDSETAFTAGVELSAAF
jgi:hypothetical protein